jgi:hypothetical protein
MFDKVRSIKVVSDTLSFEEYKNQVKGEQKWLKK